MRTAWTRPGCCRAWLTRTRWFWMAKVNGALVDLRDMPRELQVIASFESSYFQRPSIDGNSARAFWLRS